MQTHLDGGVNLRGVGHEAEDDAFCAGVSPRRRREVVHRVHAHLRVWVMFCIRTLRARQLRQIQEAQKQFDASHRTHAHLHDAGLLAQLWVALPHLQCR